MEFNELKEDLLMIAKEKGASAEADELFCAAETREELVLAIADNIAWYYRSGELERSAYERRYKIVRP